MNIHLFNGCLLGGWFLVTVGGIIINPGAGLIIGGVAMLTLTAGLALRFGIRAGAKEGEKKPGDEGS